MRLLIRSRLRTRAGPLGLSQWRIGIRMRCIITPVDLYPIRWGFAIPKASIRLPDMVKGISTPFTSTILPANLSLQSYTHTTILKSRQRRGSQSYAFRYVSPLLYCAYTRSSRSLSAGYLPHKPSPNMRSRNLLSLVKANIWRKCVPYAYACCSSGPACYDGRL